MQPLRDKMYNYEVTPPSESWQEIAGALEKDKTSDSQLFRKRSKTSTFILAAAAAIAIFVFSLIFWPGKQNGKKSQNSATSSTNVNTEGGEFDDKITVPKTSDETPANMQGLAERNRESGDILLDAISKKYLTIAGPQGQPVKISSKAATLIVSSDNQNPPKPVWSAKVNKWKDIMKANILAPTTANFLDIVELTRTLKIDN